MAGRRLNVAKSESPYAHSQDFLNMEDPPAAKETPDVSEYDLSGPKMPRSFQRDYNYSSRTHYGSGSTPTTFRAPNAGARRRSSNYMDALNQNLSEKKTAAQNNYPNFARRKSLSPGMDSQDARHDIETQICNNESDKVEDAMGDSFEPERRESTPSLFKDSYISDREGEAPESTNSTTTTNPDYYRTSFSSRDNQRPGLDRRKSSFAYEDYKKDIYNKMNMFDKN